MATKAQVERVLDRLNQLHPAETFNNVNKVNAGIGALLRMLDRQSGTATAGVISEKLGISTARVAALLKKMEGKGLIVREHSEADARVTVVSLTEYGRQTVMEMKKDMCEQIERVIDKVGEERVLEFIDILTEMESVLKPPRFDF